MREIKERYTCIHVHVHAYMYVHMYMCMYREERCKSYQTTKFNIPGEVCLIVKSIINNIFRRNIDTIKHVHRICCEWRYKDTNIYIYIHV